MGWLALGVLTEPLRRFLQPALIVALAALSAWCFWTQYRLNSERAAHATTRAEFAQAVATAQAESEQWRARAQKASDDAREQLHARQQQIEQQAARIAALQDRNRRLELDAGGLRDQLAAYAAGQAADSLTACQQRAGILAGLLAEGGALVAEASGLAEQGGRLVAESARAAELSAAERDACVSAWVR